MKRIASLLLILAACDRPARTPDGGKPPECEASPADILGDARHRRDVQCEQAIARATEAHRYNEMKGILVRQQETENARAEAERKAADEAAEDRAVAAHARKVKDDLAAHQLAHDQASAGCWTRDLGMSCAQLAVMDFGDRKTTPDPKAAEMALEHGCKLGHGLSCTFLATELSTGEHLPKNRARAAAITERACELHDETACANAANYIAEGVLEPPNMKKAAALLRKRCDANEGASCAMLGAYLSHETVLGPGKAAESRALLSKACRLQFAPACDGLNKPE